MDYDIFISNILNTRGRNNVINEYSEVHHIVPKCLGGTNDSNNLIQLTGQEHFIAHRLLYQKYPDNKQLAYAFHRMCTMKSTQQRYQPTDDEIAEARQAAANAWRGQHHTAETRRKISQKLTGIKRSEETKQKLRDANLGKVMPEETKQKISKAHHPTIYINLDDGFIGSSREISKHYNCGIRTIPCAFERHPNEQIVYSIGYHWSIQSKKELINE